MALLGTAPVLVDLRRDPEAARPRASRRSRQVADRRPITQESMASVTVHQVRKVFPNGFEAIRGLDLEIADGEFMVLVGPSGCGKSTLLRMIAGLEPVTDGTILIGDRDVTDEPPAERDIAMVFQSYALYPHMLVRENLAFGLRRRRTPRPGDPRQGRRRRPRARARRSPRAPPRPAVGRPAPAGRDRSGDGPRAGRLPHGRAAVEPGREAARVDARRACASP